jgi:SAM-dependent methyltransferase
MYAKKDEFRNHKYWINATDFFKQPYFRLEKCAKIVNKLARGKDCDLLDVGCGPATLAKLLQKNINYYGIDIAIHDLEPNLKEIDIAEDEIAFGNRKFDIVVAAGIFEYLGGLQKEKFFEIQRILNEEGKFVVTYTNFNHCHPAPYYLPYNYVVPIIDFLHDLKMFFRVDRWFPSSHNWKQHEPMDRRKLLNRIQMNIFFNIPIISPLFTVNYFFICSLKK